MHFSCDIFSTVLSHTTQPVTNKLEQLNITFYAFVLSINKTENMLWNITDAPFGPGSP